MNGRRALTGLGLGSATMLAQVTLLRELWCVAWGNEALAALALAVWLAGGALGSFRGARLARRLAPRGGSWPAALAAFALAVPAAALFLRWWPARGPGALAGAAPGPAAALLYAAASLGTAGFLAGALFPLALEAVFAADGDRAAGSLYLWDMAGSVAAGLFLTAAVTLLGFGGLRAAALASALALALAAAHLRAQRRRSWKEAAAAALAAAALAAAGGLEAPTLAWRHPHERLLSARETPAGRLEVAARQGQRSVYLSGRYAASTEDFERAEAVAAVAFGECARPRRALVLGQAVPDAARELGRLGLRVTAAVPDLEAAALAGAGPGVELLRGDGRALLRGGGEPADLIVISPGAPGTFAQARLLTRECFALCRARLSSGGVLAVELPGATAHLSVPARRAAGSVWQALGAVFPRRRLWAPPGAGLVMIGFASPGEPVARGEVAARVRAAPARLRSLAPAMLADPGLARDAEERLQPALESAGAPENRDARMSAALEQLRADRLRLRGGRFERPWLPERGEALLLAAAALLGLGLAGAGRARRRWAAPAAALAAGCAGAGLEVAALAAYQAARGSLYAEIGLVLAAFMAGGAGGAALGRRLAGAGRPRALAAALGALALVALAAAGAALPGLDGLPGGLLWAGLVAAAGAGVGAVFALAAAQPEAPRPGAVYAADLVGAAAGGLAAVAAVPWAGLPAAALAAALVVLPAALGAALPRGA